MSTLLILLALAFSDGELHVDLGGGVTLDLVAVKAGRFLQGSRTDESARSDDEMQHQVTITQDYYLGKYPVTRAQFATFVKATGYRTEAEKGTSGGFGLQGKELVQKAGFTWQDPGFTQGDDHPVCLVTYDDAMAFCRWASTRAGRPITLPTEAEWEFACRGGTGGAFYLGDDERQIGNIAWLTGDGTRAVGQKQPNAYGLHDMVGHVWQWCREWYAPYDAGPLENPEQTRDDRSDKPRRVLRGGSFLKQANHCRSAARYRNTPGSRNADNGFRVVAETGRVAAGPPSKPVAASRSEREPVAEPAPTSHWPRNSFLFALFLMIVLLVRRRWKRERAPTTVLQAAGTSAQRVQTVKDGFWFQAPAQLAGQIVSYRCKLRGEEFKSSFVVEPGPKGQFIYTGATPSDLLILGVEQAATDAFTSSSRSRPRPHDRDGIVTDDSTSSLPSSTTGFPSAY